MVVCRCRCGWGRRGHFRGSIFELGGIGYPVWLPGLITCWKYRVMRSQRRYRKGLINDIDDADDEYWLIRNAADAVDVYVDCMQSSTLQSVQSLVSISHANSDMPAFSELLIDPRYEWSTVMCTTSFHPPPFGEGSKILNSVRASTLNRTTSFRAYSSGGSWKISAGSQSSTGHNLSDHARLPSPLSFVHMQRIYKPKKLFYRI